MTSWFQIVLQLAGSLAIFMYGMTLLSDGLQRAAGERLQRILQFITANRVVAVLTGCLITIIIQSSSATTVMTVALANSGLLSLKQSIGVIIGANIGTTITAWIIAAVGIAKFNVLAAAIPLVGIGYLLTLMEKRSEKLKDVGIALLGLGFLFLGLEYIATAVPKPSPELLAFLGRFSPETQPLSLILCVAAGAVLTMIIHSSSAATAMIIPLAVKGILSFEIAAALTIGANIGTTIDAFLASLKGEATAKRAAWAHILFNVIGAVWAVIVFRPFLGLVRLVSGYGNGAGAIGIAIASLHTLFNGINTLLFLPFINQYEALLKKLVREREGGEHRMVYIAPSLHPAPELSLLQARAEIRAMAGRCRGMFDASLDLVLSNEKKDMRGRLEWFQREEQYLDDMREALVGFLLKVQTADMPESLRARVLGKMQIVAELESASDECFSIAELMVKKSRRDLKFDEEAALSLKPYGEAVKQFFDFITSNLDRGLDATEFGKAGEIENQIDSFKKELKKMARKRLNAGADARTELLYIDLVRHFEKIGDCLYAVAGELERI